MRSWVQYHNSDGLGYLPGGDSLVEWYSGTYRPSVELVESGVSTRKRVVLNAIGDTVFLIAGFAGKPKSYYLWSWSSIDDVGHENDVFFTNGDSRVLSPPQLLTGPAFESLKHRLSNFSLGLTDISEHPFTAELVRLAQEFGEFAGDKAARVRFPELAEEIPPDSVLSEGAVRTIKVNAYERSAVARSRCLAIYGPTCSVCGMNFEQSYGPSAAGLMHVHHLDPLHTSRGERTVDPERDLRPVCPNCHAVIHWGRQNRSIAEVRAMLQRTDSPVPECGD